MEVALWIVGVLSALNFLLVVIVIVSSSCNDWRYAVSSLQEKFGGYEVRLERATRSHDDATKRIALLEGRDKLVRECLADAAGVERDDQDD